MLDSKARKMIQPIFDNSANFFIKRNISANQVTLIAFIIGLIPAIMIYFNIPTIIAIATLWFSGFLDAVDGTVARKTKTSSPFGTIMDITFDRLVEISLLLVFALKYSTNVMAFVLLACSIIVSMTIFLTVGAASDKVSEKTFYYQAGLAERTEGFIMFSIMAFLPQYIDIIALIFSAMIIITASQRFYEAYRFFKE
ncbi:MAG: CDP-alcohol phosphatidyltransferase family protein [Erysipelotrichia bacterium]|jgi:CDP-diacylglycerol--glycerol-3-phosphate 3-phosphatidyltransferase|nr:CDP-alcohol phosphatidyltransferase family protein [Erysipelotrichia bacterium]